MRQTYHDDMENVKRENIRYLLDTLGGQAEVANQLGITRQAVNQWVSNGLPMDIRTRVQLHQLVRDLGLKLPQEFALTNLIYEETVK